MKRQVTILVIAALILAFIPQLTFGQEGEQKKVKIEEELKKTAEEERKALMEEQELRSKLLIESFGAAAEVRDARREARVAYGYSSGLDDVYVVGDYPQFSFFDSQNSSSIEFSKSVKDANFSKDFPAEIDTDAHKASISVSGSCKAGEIRIRITMPSGKVYTEVLIDEYGSVNWTKTFTLGEEGDDKAGTWKFLISGKEATGNFRVSVRSN
ncbi:MAG TPA: hypothetical protein VMW76_02465 [Bacteroidales bacterium]|nr:hypothetical protein [Bacteroidales bacterium]